MAEWQCGPSSGACCGVDDPVFAHAIGNLVRCFAGRAQITQSPSLPGLPSLEWSCAVCANQILERGFTNSWLIELPCKLHARRPSHRFFACSKPSCACAPSCTARRIFDPQPPRLTVEPGAVFEATGGDSKSQAAILFGGGLANLA